MKIGVLLMPQFSFLELGLILDPLFIANWLLQQSRFEWQLLGIESAAARATNGTPIPVAAELPAPETLDTIFVLASFETKTFTGNDGIRRWLQRAAQAGVELCGIETGSDVLADAGLLDGRRAAVHWDNLDGFHELYPGVDAHAELYAIDGKRLTCAGGTATLDITLVWLEPRLPAAVFTQLRQHLLASRIRGQSHVPGPYPPGLEPSNHPAVARALALMNRHLEEPLTVRYLANEVGLSVRQLERHFSRALQTTPMKHYRRLRIERAHRLLQQTDLAIADVAAASGFQSLEHFSRVYRQYYGCAPSEDRIQAIKAPAMLHDG